MTTLHVTPDAPYTSLLPLAVPIVGDFADDESHASIGYKTVLSQLVACNCRTAEGLTSDMPILDASSLLASIACKNHFDPICHPYPLAIDENNQSEHLAQSSFRKHLHMYNILAIISAGQTSTTHDLLRLLAPSNIPLCITVASSDKLFDGPIKIDNHRYSYTNILRLNPSNDQQAKAIVARVRSLLDNGIGRTTDRGGTPKDFTLVSDVSEPYASDLATSLHRQTLTPPELSYHARTHFSEIPGGGIVVYLGYKRHLDEFTPYRGPYRGVIMICSPKSDPRAMRVPTAREGRRILDEAQATHAGADSRQAPSS